MTITLSWWALPVAIIVVGFVAMMVIASRATDWDFLTPLLAAGTLVIAIGVAVGLVIGKLFL